MSNRSLDKGLIEFLRSLTSRVQRLEAQNNAVRRNDIRLGNVIVTADALYNRIGLQNVKTKEQRFIGNPNDAVFSYSGTLAADTTSPPHVVPYPSIAREIVVSCLPENQASTDTDFVVYFNNGDLGVSITLQGGSNLEIRGINVPVGTNQNIYVKCTSTHSSDFPPTDVSVFVRFGSTASVNPTESDV